MSTLNTTFHLYIDACRNRPSSHFDSLVDRSFDETANRIGVHFIQMICEDKVKGVDDDFADLPLRIFDSLFEIRQHSLQS